ncbi:MAG: hypothetical protein Q4C37_10005 [Bacteroidales bacterium]|nr:hypothetical protein [Bacteroidales bacterium]
MDIPPDFYDELKHNKLRRADWHDYHSKCFYLITLMKNPSALIPVFSNIIAKDNAITTDFTWSGWGIYNGIQEFKRYIREVTIWTFVIMPDHVHLIMSADERLDKHFGRYVSYLKTLCTQKVQSKSRLQYYTEEAAFCPGFNDRILLQHRQLQKWNRYIYDNPRRLWLMRSVPDFFLKAALIDSDKLPSELWPTGQKPMIQLYGNRLLLEYPELCVVRFSRRFSVETWQIKKRDALRVAGNGGVLVSPFIHKEEKAIFEEGVRLGARTIKVISDGFLDRAKPQGADFYHCAEGRMLLVAMNAGAFTPTRTSREICERMNKLAVWIAENAGRLMG